MSNGRTKSQMQIAKRVLSFVMVLTMILTLAPTFALAAGDTTLYLKPNTNWKQDNARYAIYYWNGGGSTAWTSMTDADGDGYYEGTVPSGYTSVIFCRMNPNTTANNWDNKWNQSVDLTVPTNGTNCYTVAEGAWEKGSGTWSTYTPKEEETTAPTETTAPDVADGTYYVAGDSAFCGVEWSENAPANKMDYAGNGVYEKVYTNVAAGTYGIKVTNGTWDAGGNWGDEGNNYTFIVSATCDVTVTFNSNTKTVSVTGASVTKKVGLDITAMYAVGNGSGNWLNGANWNPAATANVMTETSDGIYEITFKNIPGNGDYQFKFAANGSWTDNWGAGGAADEAAYNSQTNFKATVTPALANVTLKLDLTGYDPSTKTGAKYSVTVTEASSEPAVDYYLVGYINGADYGIEADASNLGDYKFANGKLTATFTADSYVMVKTGDNAKWYMTDGWLGSVTEAPLYDSSTLGETANKLQVPGNVEVTFTLTENSDGSLTLSYTTGSAEEPEIPEGYTAVTIHFLKPDSWGATVNGYVWTSTGDEIFGGWPGKATTTSGSDHPGWYDMVVATEDPTAFNFIFNDGSNQTADLATGEITGDTELWVMNEEVLTEAPDDWKGIYTHIVNIHFQNAAGWSAVNAKLGQGDSWTAIEGYTQYMDEYGAAVEANAYNDGWYSLSITIVGNNAAINGLFNNGSWGDGNQTGNFTTGTLVKGTKDYWYSNGALSTTAPAGWFDTNLEVFVPGTFPGPSWDAGSNKMTFDPELGLYVYTFKDVPAANYEFKIYSEGHWYGDEGKVDTMDGNYAVTVPSTQDVTVYYSSLSHNAATSVDYIFADIALSGTGIPAGTKLSDPDLTGIYSVTVDMTAGTYDDVKLTCDGEDYPFAEFKLTADKAVTFYMDPVTGLYYNDASSTPIDASKIYYNSKKAEYKSIFGAVATGEEVTFSIDTGADITSAVLIIKGVGSYPMTSAKTDAGQRWSTTTSLPYLGEYDYYFAVSNGSAVAVYCDDDKYYGEGKVTDLTNVNPYDLVVYQAGFETPDWMKNAVIYQIFPDRFFDGDPNNNDAQDHARGEVNYEYIGEWYTWPENPEQKNSGRYPSQAHNGDGQWSNEIYGGDLQGIIQRIDYLKALGVNVIYLNPVFSSISSHRYDACDYTEIDPILGTLGDFEELVAVAEANGMHIILDGVFNHVSDDSIYFDRYYRFLGTSEKIGAYPYWAYVYDYMAEQGATKAEAEAAAKAYFAENYGVTDYSYTEWFQVNNTYMSGAIDNVGLRAGKGVYSYQGWWGYDSMPIIYSTNGSEFQTGNWAEEIIYNEDGTSVTQYWITKGNNGWRLDVANEVSDETWINFRDSVKSLDSDVVIIGEIWDDATKYLMGNMYDSVMNYVFRNAVTSFAMGTDATTTTNELERLRERYPEEAFYAMMNLVGSHDTTRILSYLDGIPDDRTGAIDNPASAFPTYETTSSTAKNRQYLVAFLQFTYPGAPTIYYGDEIGMVGADDPDDRRAMEWGKGNQELVEWYAKLAAIRAAYPALSTGSIEPFVVSSNIMGYVRSANTNARAAAESLIVLANNAASSQVASVNLTNLGIEADKLTDLITGTEYTVSNGTVRVTVEGRRGAILVSSEQVKDITVNTAGLAPAYDSSYIVGEREVGAMEYTTTDDQTAYVGDSLDFPVEDALVNTFEGVEIDGEALDPEDYSVSAGENGTIITLSADYIAELGEGEYTISIIFNGGVAEAVFNVEEKPEETTESTEPSTDSTESTEATKPSDDSTEPTTKPGTGENAVTGDNSNIVLWVMILAVSCAAIVVLVILAIKKKKTDK